LASQSGHDARVDADAAGILGEGDVAHPVVLVLDRPVIANGGGEGLGGQHDGGGVEGGFPARGPLPGRGGTDEGIAFHAHDGGDQRLPLGFVERRSGKVNRDAAVFLAIARTMATVVDGDRRGCRGDVFEATQQARLVVLDLDDQGIAGVAGDLEGFFGSAWRRA